MENDAFSPLGASIVYVSAVFRESTCSHCLLYYYQLFSGVLKAVHAEFIYFLGCALLVIPGLITDRRLILICPYRALRRHLVYLKDEALVRHPHLLLKFK